MEVHEVCTIFPLMSDEEFEGLKADIAVFGQREPIWVHEGKIIDGRNRYRACHELGIEVEAREWDGEGDLTSFVVSLNLHRRHLDTSQRGMVAARVKHLFEEEAKARRNAELKQHRSNAVQANLPERHRTANGQARDRAAELLNVSARTVEAASRVLRNGTPELIRAADSSQVKVSAAAELARLTAEQQREIIAEGPRVAKAAAKAIRQAEPDVDPSVALADRHRKHFLKCLADIDDLTRAVAARVKDGGYGGLPAVLDLIGQHQSKVLLGKVETLLERLQGWHTSIQEHIGE